LFFSDAATPRQNSVKPISSLPAPVPPRPTQAWNDVASGLKDTTHNTNHASEGQTVVANVASTRYDVVWQEVARIQLGCDAIID